MRGPTFRSQCVASAPSGFAFQFRGLSLPGPPQDRVDPHPEQGPAPAVTDPVGVDYHQVQGQHGSVPAGGPRRHRHAPSRQHHQLRPRPPAVAQFPVPFDDALAIAPPSCSPPAGLNPSATKPPPRPGQPPRRGRPRVRRAAAADGPAPTPWSAWRVIEAILARHREQRPLNAWAVSPSHSRLYSAAKRHLGCWDEALRTAGFDSEEHQCRGRRSPAYKPGAPNSATDQSQDSGCVRHTLTE